MHALQSAIRLPACIAAVTAIAAVVSMAGQSTAHAATAAGPPPRVPYYQPTPITSWQTGKMAGASWLIKANDYAEFPASYGSWRWVTCGKSVTYGGDAPWTKLTDPTYPVSAAPCEPGQIPTFTSYWALVRWLARGNRKGETVVFDTEKWKWTPVKEQQHQAHYIKLGCQDAAAHGVTVISTPAVGPPPGADPVWTASATYCPIAEVQSQGWESNPVAFQHRVSQFLRIVRASGHAKPMIGLATDPGGTVVTAAQLLAAFKWATAKGVHRFWMNACAWWGKPRMDGTGDPQIAEQFFTDLGIPGP